MQRHIDSLDLPDSESIKLKMEELYSKAEGLR
jgi:hypothetical protein